MLQFPAFMSQYPSPTLIPPSLLLPCSSPHSHNEDLLLSMEESALEDKLRLVDPTYYDMMKLNEIRKTNSNVVVIGKTTLDNDKEDMDADADDDDADNVESEIDEFEQETG